MINEAEKILIEQTIFNISNENLTGEDYLIEAINHYINSDSPAYGLCEILQESIEYSEYNKYIPLIEAIDMLNEATKESKPAKEVKDAVNVVNKVNSEEDAAKAQKKANKLVEAVKKAVNWYYKVDPETKSKNVRTIHNLLISAAGAVLKIIMYWKIAGHLTIGGRLIVAAANIGKKVLHIKNKSSEKPVAEGNTGKSAPTGKFDGRFILSIILDKAISTVIDLTKGIDHSLYYNINLKDIDSNIAKYDKLIDEFNDKISEEDDIELRKSLIKGRDNCVRALRDLYTIREEKNQKDKLANKDQKGIRDYITIATDKTTKKIADKM